MPDETNKIYLTFDDGPMPGPTDYVLQQLEVFNAKATFFCIGDNVNKHPDLFDQLRAHSHAVGNHTHNHLKGWNVNNEAYLENIVKCQQLIGDTKLFRPPYGRAKRSQLRQLRNYKVVMWDVLSHDYSKSLQPEKCLKGVIKAIRPGSIVVFHDSLKAERNMQYVLPRLLDHFANRNFEFVSLPEF